MKWLLLSSLFITPALAHSWYDKDCCSDTDCHPIASCDELQEGKNGSYSWTSPEGVTFYFRPDRVRPSQDKHCHVCTLSSAYGLCAYIQLGY